MKHLVIDEPFVKEMVAHCEAGRPNEACGVLAAKDGRIVNVFLMTNTSHSPVRYSVDADELHAVYKIIDDRGWELGGIFHSHTRTEAYPSPTDVRRAMEDVPYVIVSLAEGPPDVRAFRIVKENWLDEDGTIEEIPVVTS